MSKKKTKEKKTKRIIKLITDGKLDKALELADVDDVEDLLGIGVLFGQNEIHNVAEKIFTRVAQLNPNLDKAWYNKGIALGNLGKYDEAIKCYDEAIKINPNYDKAWSNKGIALGNLGKYDEEIKCYDEAIKINPNLAEARGNLGITLLNLHKYNEAVTELRKAQELFSMKGAKKDANKAYRYKLFAINSSKLIYKLKPLDEEFINSLGSQCLIELRENSLRISKDIEGVIEEFKKRELPKDAMRLLVSKASCFTALSKTLQFEKVDLKELRHAQDVFEEWDLNTFSMAVGSLTVFIQGINRYRGLRDISKIPKEVEDYLLQFLRASYVLDGKLTEEITGKIKGEPYLARPTSVEKEPEIKRIPISDIAKDRIRVCLVQLDFLLTKKYPYQLEKKGKMREKILKALEVAKEKEVNIICFPELSFAEEFVSKVKKYRDIIIIGGSFYHDNFNICPVIINGKDYPVYKIHPSPTLESEIAPGKGMKPGKDIKIFSTKDGKFKFGVLICLDYLEESYRLYKYRNEKESINTIFNPSFNPDPGRFQRRADSDCENYHVDLIQVNVKDWGGTCIIGIEHKDIIKRLVNEGYRQNDDIKYKLCEVKGEMMIIVDLSMMDLKVPTPLGAKPRIQIIGCYVYENGCWQQK